MIKEYDLSVPMRDGITLKVDVYRPHAPGRYPVLYTCAMHNKDLQRVELAENPRVSPESIAPVVPGEVNEYQIEVLATANLFKTGHRICLDITCLDLAEGVGGENAVEYIPNHVCSRSTVLHKVVHNAECPSRLLLPVIPAT